MEELTALEQDAYEFLINFCNVYENELDFESKLHQMLGVLSVDVGWDGLFKVLSKMKEN